jgi:hypothetical protein
MSSISSLPPETGDSLFFHLTLFVFRFVIGGPAMETTHLVPGYRSYFREL